MIEESRDNSVLVGAARKLAKNLLVEADPVKLTLIPPPVLVFTKEAMDDPEKDPDTAIGTENEAEDPFKFNWLELITRLEDPEFRLNRPEVVKLMDVLAVKLEVTPETVMSPLVLCKFKFLPDTMSKESEGATNLIA